jgi:hypothetical protein
MVGEFNQFAGDGLFGRFVIRFEFEGGACNLKREPETPHRLRIKCVSA